MNKSFKSLKKHLKKAQHLLKTREFNKNLLRTTYDIFQHFKVRSFAKIFLWKVMMVLLTFGSYLCRYIECEIKILSP